MDGKTFQGRSETGDRYQEVFPEWHWVSLATRASFALQGRVGGLDRVGQGVEPPPPVQTRPYAKPRGASQRFLAAPLAGFAAGFGVTGSAAASFFGVGAAFFFGA